MMDMSTISVVIFGLITGACVLHASAMYKQAKAHWHNFRRSQIMQDAIIARVAEIIDVLKDSGHEDASALMKELVMDRKALTDHANRIQALRS